MPMGSDDLFRKKIARQSYVRPRPSKDAQKKILIVCEDSKSSAYYLEALVKDLGLRVVKDVDSSGIRIEGKNCGSAPCSVLEYALSEYAKSKRQGDAYDRIYCVFDRDTHDSFDVTVQKITTIKPKDTFFAITTTPCFEFWLSLHFEYSSASFAAKGKKSPCDCANEALTANDKLPNYGKNKHQIYDATKHKLADAIVNAKRLAQENTKTQSSDPQTNMYELVEYLQSIKR